ncbi:MAG TPA: PEGA domain-containing protein [Candidatus Saccharimonadales bacterium]|nr:PEGA domain-containing protein [Candidatus Saccharimonadales bacterium]
MTAQLKKLIYIGVGLLALGLIIVVFVLGLQSRDKTATIEIQSAVPTDAKVTIDGGGVGSNRKNGVTPGKHTVVAKRDGFEDKTQEVEVKQGEAKIIRLLMTPNSQVGYEWMRAHPDLAVEYEAMVGQQFSAQSDKTVDANPLIQNLPEIHPTWRVDYGKSVAYPNDPNKVAIIITYGGAEIDKQNAINWIKSLGFNPADYEIVYKVPPQPGG